VVVVGDLGVPSQSCAGFMFLSAELRYWLLRGIPAFIGSGYYGELEVETVFLLEQVFRFESDFFPAAIGLATS
jgi:hypothetical protein